MSEREKLFRLLRFVVIGFLCLIALMFISVPAPDHGLA